jgi:sugar-specific transcriptional regulator TrmB
MEKNILEKIGFTQGEIKVYLALLKLGKSSSGKIVNISEVSKSKVYEILERLTNKGIVSQVIENKIKVFQAMHPKELLNYYEKKENELKTTKEELKKILPEYEQLYNSQEKQEVTVFKGYDGLKKILNLVLDTLNEGDTYYVFVSPTTPKDFTYFYEFDRKRINKKINLKIIYNQEVDIESINLIKKKDDKYFFPKLIGSGFKTPTVFNIFNDKTAIIIWSENPIGILIDNKDTAKSFEKYFDVLWKLAKLI